MNHSTRKVLTFGSVEETKEIRKIHLSTFLWCTVCDLCIVVLIIESVDETLKCDRLNEIHIFGK